MQSFSSSCVRQPFAITKCCHSKEKKPRRRLSKEERKMMVESYINKYRNVHSGEFPSLNLTHKEVGGSFYTVREIVREIIQENRILGPGGLTSESLNFEDYIEEDQKHPGIDYELSLSSFVPAKDCMEPKVVSVSSEHEAGNLQQTEAYMEHGVVLSHQNSFSISSSVESAESNLSQLNKDTVDSVEVKTQKPITQSHSSRTYEAPNLESQTIFSNSIINKFEQISPVEEFLFSNAPEKEVVSDENTVNNSILAVETSSTNVSTSVTCKILGEDSLTRDEILSSESVSNSSSQSLDSSADSEENLPPFENSAIEMSKGVIKDSSDDSQQVLVQNSETQVAVSSSQKHEISPVHNTENIDVFPYDIVDKETNHSAPPISESFSSLPGPSRSEADLTTNTYGRAYVSTSQDQGLQDISIAELKEKEHNDHKTEADFNSRSQLHQESDDGRASVKNPFWEAIKAVVSAVVKFWTE